MSTKKVVKPAAVKDAAAPAEKKFAVRVSYQKPKGPQVQESYNDQTSKDLADLFSGFVGRDAAGTIQLISLAVVPQAIAHDLQAKARQQQNGRG